MVIAETLIGNNHMSYSSSMDLPDNKKIEHK